MLKPLYIGLLLASLVYTCPAVAWARSDLPEAATNGLQDEALEREKLRQEIRELRLKNQESESWAARLPAATTFVAVVGILLTIWKQINQQNADRRQRQDESQRRSDEKFTKIIGDLGSQYLPVQAGAAVSLLTFLKPKYRELHEQVFLILLANLKIEHDETINKLMVDGFQKALRARVVDMNRKEPLVIDLSHTRLSRIDLSGGIDLTGTDIAFADLRHANFSGSFLRRARGIQANLEKARLSRCDLEEARLQKANLSGAQMHSARLISADLKYAQPAKCPIPSGENASRPFGLCEASGCTISASRPRRYFLFRSRIR